MCVCAHARACVCVGACAHVCVCVFIHLCAYMLRTLLCDVCLLYVSVTRFCVLMRNCKCGVFFLMTHCMRMCKTSVDEKV